MAILYSVTVKYYSVEFYYLLLFKDTMVKHKIQALELVKQHSYVRTVMSVH